ncbi:MAG: FAD binding domain-containing protein [Pyrinomonadaceae bacterium]|nr:FAD binding domain-containing protein [Pyrinomonadaceae bacterium]
MIKFILNDQDISTDLPTGSTVLDFVRYRQDLKGTKIGCREGDCGACTILVGELIDGEVRYRSMTSCLMPLANASGKHIVTIEGINPTDGSLTPVQQAMVDESGTQCGFCTVGFVMSLTGACIDGSDKISAIDGNICRCTGYKSIERAACRLSEPPWSAGGQIVPEYFSAISQRLERLLAAGIVAETRPPGNVPYVGGGTDLYVQRHDEMAESAAMSLLHNDELRGIRDTGTYIEIGGAATVTDLLESPEMNEIFPELYKHLKLVSSTPIRNMATLAGNFVNASPIGDMTVWFLALDAEIDLWTSPHVSKGITRTLALKELYLGYKQLAKQPDEIITAIRFRKPNGDFRFNFEKVCKRTYLDIASVNTAISLTVRSAPGDTWLPPALSEPGAPTGSLVTYTIESAHVAAGGVSPIPLYLRKTSEFLAGKAVNAETISSANEIMQSEISPISDVRGTEQYKRLLLRQLFAAHFVELFEA